MEQEIKKHDEGSTQIESKKKTNQKNINGKTTTKGHE